MRRLSSTEPSVFVAESSPELGIVALRRQALRGAATAEYCPECLHDFPRETTYKGKQKIKSVTCTEWNVYRPSSMVN